MERLEDIIGKEYMIEWNLMLQELFKGTTGAFILQEHETHFELTFKVPLPKHNRKGIQRIVEQILRFRGTKILR